MESIYKGEGVYFNTYNSITVYDPRKELIEEVFSICERFEKLLSKTIAGSDVWRIGHADGHWVEIDDHTAKLIKIALEYSRISGGLFDISIGHASSLWNLKDGSKYIPSEEIPSEKIPSEEMLASAIARIGYEQIELKENLLRVPPGVELDLGGIAKGYIADCIVEYLGKQGVKSAIINLGGNIYALGRKYDGRPWNIGIRDPDGMQKDYVGILSVINKSVVTSGIYERNVKKGNILYHHILHPETGWPVQNDLSSVTVISDRSVDGDALSTVCLLSGMQSGLELIESISGIEAVFISRNREIRGTSGIGRTVSCKFIKGNVLQKDNEFDNEFF